MNVLILVIVIIGTLLAIASGVWVAIALVSAISTYQEQTNKKKNNPTVP